MSKIANFKSGTRRVIIFTGEVSELADALVSESELDPGIERAITTAALSLQYTRRARHFGELMIEMANHPEKH